MGPDGICILVWRNLEDVVIVLLTNSFNLIFQLNNMPDK
jgi:hypothetical protein